MVVFIGQELLVTELEHLRILVIDIVDVLIGQVDGLPVLLHDQLGALDFTLLVEVWNDQQLIEGGFSHGLSELREENLLASNQLDLIPLVVTELDAVLRELKGALGWVLTFEPESVILASHLVLRNLRNGVGMSGEKALLLVENF